MNAPPLPGETIAAIEANDDFFARSGPLPTAFDEDRRFPRFYYRARVEAIIHSLTSAGRPSTHCTLLTDDLSRGGMKLIHTEQLFPGQRIDLVLTDGSQRTVEVLWCRRIADGCYSLGCRFTKGETTDAETAATG